MKNNIGNDMKSFNQQLFSMDIEDLKLTKDLITDLIKNKIKGFLCIFFGFTYWQMYLFPILYTYMKKKNTMKQKNSKNDVDTNIYALVKQKNNSLKRVPVSDLKKKSKNEKIFDNNLKFMSNENDTISEEDYYLSDALAQDGESIENYAI